MLFLYCSLLLINQADNQFSFLLPLLRFILGGMLCMVSQALEMTPTLLPVLARCGCLMFLWEPRGLNIIVISRYLTVSFSCILMVE